MTAYVRFRIFMRYSRHLRNHDHAGFLSRGAIGLGISSAASDAWYRRSRHLRPACLARRKLTCRWAAFIPGE